MTLDRQLLESDRGYFERGARLTTIPGAVLAHAPRFKDLAAGTVVHRIEPRRLTPDPLSWLVALEHRLTRLDVPLARLYLDRPAPELEWALAHLGYQQQEEIGLIHPAEQFESEVTLTAISGDEEWRDKQALHLGHETGPDGHENDPARWVAYERFKQDAGYFTLYLAWHQGQACGTVGFADAGAILRLKNIVVAPAHRRRGIGAAILRAAVRVAHDQRKHALGCFALAGEAGEALYREAGFTALTKQWSWHRRLDSAASRQLSPRLAHAHR